MTKIDIISGFLGAGKTTLIKKLIKETLYKEKIVLIENEFGEIGIDGGFMKESGIQVTEMNSGCICCSLVGDFSTALKEVLEKYSPDRIIIEPSGVGKLSDVIKAVEEIAEHNHVSLNSYVTIADAKKSRIYMKNFGEFYNNQIQYARTIILSRTDEMTEDKLNQCISMIRTQNKTAVIITTPWNNISGDMILEEMEMKKTLEQKVFDTEDHHHDCGCHEGHEHHHDCECHEGHEHHHDCECHEGHEHHHAEEVFNSWGIETHRKYTKDELTQILKVLSEEKEYGIILRGKGMLQDKNGKWMHFDMVPGEYEIREGAPMTTGRICIIGSGINKDKIAELFMVIF